MPSLPFTLATALIALAPVAAAAEPLTLAGTVGRAPVLLMLEREQGKLTGWYLYPRVGKLIRLEGEIRQGGDFTLDEFAPPFDRKTGAFAGATAQGRWTGTWRKTGGGAPQPLALAEERRPLADLTTDIKCTARKTDKEFGYSYRYDLKLQVNKGIVGKIDLSQRATTKAGDDQGCALNLADLKQVPLAPGVMLKTEDAGEGGEPRCTVRLIGVGDYLYVKIGDNAQNGNDCRGGEGVAYCSPRSFWAGMIVDRKTRACKPVH